MDKAYTMEQHAGPNANDLISVTKRIYHMS